MVRLLTWTTILETMSDSGPAEATKTGATAQNSTTKSTDTSKAETRTTLTSTSANDETNGEKDRWEPSVDRSVKAKKRTGEKGPKRKAVKKRGKKKKKKAVKKKRGKKRAKKKTSGREKRIVIEGYEKKIKSLLVENNQLNETVEKHQKTADDYLVRLTRLSAEFDNYRKRSRKQIKEHVNRTKRNLFLDILDVMDNFDRALDSIHTDTMKNNEQTQRLVTGLDLTYRQFSNVLQSHDITPIDAKGDPFDPRYHEALSQVEDGTVPDETVLHEVRKGYLMNDQLLRPAQVIVSKTPAEEPSTEDEQPRPTDIAASGKKGAQGTKAILSSRAFRSESEVEEVDSLIEWENGGDASHADEGGEDGLTAGETTRKEGEVGSGAPAAGSDTAPSASTDETEGKAKATRSVSKRKKVKKGTSKSPSVKRQPKRKKRKE